MIMYGDISSVLECRVLGFLPHQTILEFLESVQQKPVVITLHNHFIRSIEQIGGSDKYRIEVAQWILRRFGILPKDL